MAGLGEEAFFTFKVILIGLRFGFLGSERPSFGGGCVFAESPSSGMGTKGIGVGFLIDLFVDRGFRVVFTDASSSDSSPPGL